MDTKSAFLFEKDYEAGFWPEFWVWCIKFYIFWLLLMAGLFFTGIAPALTIFKYIVIVFIVPCFLSGIRMLSFFVANGRYKKYKKRLAEGKVAEDKLKDSYQLDDICRIFIIEPLKFASYVSAVIGTLQYLKRNEGEVPLDEFIAYVSLTFLLVFIVNVVNVYYREKKYQKYLKEADAS